MKRDVSISVIICTYNNESNISECLDSLLNQSDTDFEVIIQDNASCDNTFNVISDYETKFREKNIFFYTDRNKRRLPIFNCRKIAEKESEGLAIIYLPPTCACNNNLIAVVRKEFSENVNLTMLRIEQSEGRSVSCRGDEYAKALLKEFDSNEYALAVNRNVLFVFKTLITGYTFWDMDEISVLASILGEGKINKQKLIRSKVKKEYGMEAFFEKYILNIQLLNLIKNEFKVDAENDFNEGKKILAKEALKMSQEGEDSFYHLSKALEM